MTEGKERRAAAACGAELLFLRSRHWNRHGPVLRRGAARGPAGPLTSASPHMKFGEIVGLAVREATLEALALAERAGAELHARAVSRARPLRHQREDHLRRLAAVLDAATSNSCARTTSRCSTSRWLARPRMRWRPCSTARDFGRCRPPSRGCHCPAGGALAASLAAQTRSLAASSARACTLRRR